MAVSKKKSKDKEPEPEPAIVEVKPPEPELDKDTFSEIVDHIQTLHDISVLMYHKHTRLNESAMAKKYKERSYTLQHILRRLEAT